MSHIEDAVPRIKALATSVVNMIAAGEIIIAPANALKEMVENSIDAGATMIDILVKDGGMKLLQITDNGSGIHKDDLALLCERFTTSKLKTYEDLSTIATYGFRGEALASISHIAHFSVITKTKSEPVAYKAFYSDGKLVPGSIKDTAEPKPVAGKDGTQIIVEDLFYNVPSRLKSLKSKTEEFSKILDVVGRYSIHTEGVGFSCKKFGETHHALTVRNNLTLKERIRVVFGSGIANELLDFELPQNDEYGLIRVRGSVTNSNHANKKRTQPVFFINNRLVTCEPLKRSIFSAYQFFLPKGNSPFVYLSLEIKPQNVDVNVHPTKREVRFLHEDEIIEIITVGIHKVLSSVDTSRTFKTQSVLLNQLQSKRNRDEVEYESQSTTAPQITKKIRQENKLVRVDASQSKINTYMKYQNEERRVGDTQQDSNQSAATISVCNENDSTSVVGQIDERAETIYTQVNKPKVQVNLSSILDLRQQVDARMNASLTDIFSKSSYIGIADEKRRLAVIQHDVKLFLIDYASILYEFFYQISLAEFSNFGTFVFKNEISLKEILEPLYSNSVLSQDAPKMDDILTTILSMKDMYKEYFSISFNDSDALNPTLVSIPMLIKGYEPPFSKLAFFLYRLGSKINYEEEISCLDGIMRQISLLYLPESLDNSKVSDEKLDAVHEKKLSYINDMLEHVIFPQVKRSFLATGNLSRDVVQIADLPGLYKVFERC